jgi:hypothetical protein
MARLLDAMEMELLRVDCRQHGVEEVVVGEGIQHESPVSMESMVCRFFYSPLLRGNAVTDYPDRKLPVVVLDDCSVLKRCDSHVAGNCFDDSVWDLELVTVGVASSPILAFQLAQSMTDMVFEMCPSISAQLASLVEDLAWDWTPCLPAQSCRQEL